MRKLIALFVLAFAFDAHASSHTFTIDTPPVMVWVGPTGTVVGPFVTWAFPLYADPATGYVWPVQGTGTSSPAAVGLPLGGFAGTFYTTTNCTGAVYLIVSPFDVPSVVRSAGSSTAYYVAGTAAAVTIHSQFLNGTCFADTETANIYAAIGPLTPPTLPTGPWHLEVR